jgi:pimeloyl-ACP methyl ester carboxylesterase
MRVEHRKTFVLIAGGWCGAWVWRDVIPKLRSLGHHVSAPTLSGLGERRHVGNATADLSTHVEDVVVHMEMEDLQDVTLVGWSYGGIVTTGVLASAPERIRSMIYLDAFVPENGKAWIDYALPQSRSAMESYRQRDEAIPPPPLSYFKVTEPTLVDFITPRLVHHPWRTLFEPVSMSQQTPDLPVAYIRCLRHDQAALTEAFERTGKTGAITLSIDADHFCPLTAPEETARVLAQLASDR